MKNGDLTPLKSPKNRPRRHEVALRRRNFGAGRWTAGAGARAGPGGDRSGKKTCMKFSTHRIHVWYIYIYMYILTLGVYWWDPCYQHHGSYGVWNGGKHVWLFQVFLLVARWWSMYDNPLSSGRPADGLGCCGIPGLAATTEPARLMVQWPKHDQPFDLPEWRFSFEPCP